MFIFYEKLFGPKTILTYITKIFLYAFFSSFSCFLSLAFSHFCEEIFRFSKYLLAREALMLKEKEIERKSCCFHREISFSVWKCDEKSGNPRTLEKWQIRNIRRQSRFLTWLWEVERKELRMFIWGLFA